MKLSQKYTGSLSKIKKIGIVVTAIIILFVGGWAWSNFSPKPLGDKLEYLGKNNLGGGLLFYDHKPYAVYYYGTDMTPEEVVEYLKGATIDNRSDIKNLLERGGSPSIQFISSKNQTPFTITYHTDPANSALPDNIEPSKRKHLISIIDSDYELIKDSL